MKRINWQIILGLVLIVLSVVLYGIHYVIFHDLHHIFIYLVGDIAFVPIEVLLVTLIIHRILNAREKRALMRKMNMVIGTFFGEVGTELLGLLSQFHSDREQLARELIFEAEWNNARFVRVTNFVTGERGTMDSRSGDIENVKQFLLKRRGFLVRLLGNPNLIEHDAFTDMLWAVLHLTEELDHRQEVTGLSGNDYDHISGDMQRAYTRLIVAWLSYMKHLKEDYPYLFSLAVRTNPFDTEASVEFA